MANSISGKTGIAGAPVNSRLAANKPQNSRSPGVYGPGE